MREQRTPTPVHFRFNKSWVMSPGKGGTAGQAVSCETPLCLSACWGAFHGALCGEWLLSFLCLAVVLPPCSSSIPVVLLFSWLSSHCHRSTAAQFTLGWKSISFVRYEIRSELKRLVGDQATQWTGQQLLEIYNLLYSVFIFFLNASVRPDECQGSVVQDWGTARWTHLDNSWYFAPSLYFFHPQFCCLRLEGYCWPSWLIVAYMTGHWSVTSLPLRYANLQPKHTISTKKKMSGSCYAWFG